MFRGLLSLAVIVAFPSLTFAQQPCTRDARRVVDELYRHILERPADASSRGWADKLTSGTTVREVVNAIVDSPEHMQRFSTGADGAVANERAVVNLYRHLLGRQPDADGLRAYTAMAATGGLQAVAHSILASDEYSRTFGDWGVPGAAGLTYCANGRTTQSAVGTTGATSTQRFPGLDTNRNGMIERNEWRGSPRAFGIRDWNNDGVLSGDEVQIAAAPPANSVEALDYNMPNDDRFGYLDVNNNGSIDRNEWDGSWDSFYRLDRNDDGQVTRAEMGSRRNPSPFAMMDTNGDRRITLGEWPYSHRSFDQQDANGDGVITSTEFNLNTLPSAGR